MTEQQWIFLDFMIYFFVFSIIVLIYVIRESRIKDSETKEIFEKYAKAKKIEYAYTYDNKTGGIEISGEFISQKELEAEANKMILNLAGMAIQNEENRNEEQTTITKKLLIVWEK